MKQNIRRDSIDRELLHGYMWKNIDNRDMLKLTQQQLADMLGVHKITITNIMKELKDDGRLIKKGNHFKVVDPVLSAWRTNKEVKYGLG